MTIQVLTQAREELIVRTFEALKGAPAIVHLYNATAPVMRKVVLGLDEDGIVQLARRRPACSRSWLRGSPDGLGVPVFARDVLRHRARVRQEGGRRGDQVWQPTPAHKCIINLPSTVEHSTPNIFADMVEWMHRHLARRDAIVLSVHPHNDRGTGTPPASSR